MKKSLFVFLTVVLANTLAAGQYRASEWDERDNWQDPQTILRSLSLTSGMSVADIGCHEGYLAMKLSPLVGPEGQVLAVDVDQYKLTKLDRRLKSQDIKNVRTILGEYHDPKLPRNSLDAVVILDAYHEMEAYEEILAHIFKALKPGGRLVLVEPIADERVSWTRKQQAKKHEIALRFALADLRQAGFSIRSKRDPFIQRDAKNDRMWMVVALKPRS